MSPRVLLVIVAIVVVIAAGTIIALKRAVKTSTRDPTVEMGAGRVPPPPRPPRQ
jgi:hypothetical protein